MINKLLIYLFDRCIVTLEPKPNVITDTNRYYSSEVLDKAIKAYIKKFVSKKKAFGELHPIPNMDNPYASMAVSINNISHMFTKIWKWKGEYKALIRLVPPMNSGKILKAALLHKPNNIAFKLRAAGTVHRNETLGGNYDVINDNLRIISWDASPRGEMK